MFIHHLFLAESITLPMMMDLEASTLITKIFWAYEPTVKSSGKQSIDSERICFLCLSANLLARKCVTVLWSPVMTFDFYYIKIFSTGKSLNFIRYSCLDSDWVVTREKMSNTGGSKWFISQTHT